MFSQNASWGTSICEKRTFLNEPGTLGAGLGALRDLVVEKRKQKATSRGLEVSRLRRHGFIRLKVLARLVAILANIVLPRSPFLGTAATSKEEPRPNQDIRNAGGSNQ
jgi:hypothetical protein